MPDEKANGEAPDYYSAFRWASLAFELVGAVAVLALIGYLLDYWLGSAPWGLVICITLGLVLGFFNLIKQASKTLQ